MTACERARQWISLELDGELSELEQAALARHLDGCRSCRAVSACVGGFTWMLREQPLTSLERHVVVARPRSNRSMLAWRVAAALAASAAAGTLTGVLVLPHRNRHVSSALAFQSVAQQQRFALDHIRGEPRTREEQRTAGAASYRPAFPSLAARALR
jgi:predicted anti-sigma-YlaC factor YlaD